MIKNVLSVVAAGLMCGSLAFAAAPAPGGETCAALQECPTAKKVNDLLGQWKTAAAAAEKLSPEARQARSEKLAGIAQRCPVGSRMNDTLSAVRDVLGIVVASSEANAEHCPLKNAPESEACAAGKELLAARAQVLGMLNELAGYAACSTSCPEKAAAQATCATEAGGQGNCCPIRAASRVGEMKASLALARREAEALSPEARGQIMASFTALGAEESQCALLIPASVSALAEGFAALATLHGKMAGWCQQNPDLMGSLPASAHQTFMMESALLGEAHGLLKSMEEAMQAMHPAGITVGQATR